MGEFDEAWSRIRMTAEKIAGDTQTLTQREAEVLVLQIVRAERAETPPQEALEYLARELCSMVEAYRRDGNPRGEPYLRSRQQ